MRYQEVTDYSEWIVGDIRPVKRWRVPKPYSRYLASAAVKRFQSKYRACHNTLMRVLRDADRVLGEAK